MSLPALFLMETGRGRRKKAYLVASEYGSRGYDAFAYGLSVQGALCVLVKAERPVSAGKIGFGPDPVGDNDLMCIKQQVNIKHRATGVFARHGRQAEQILGPNQNFGTVEQ